MGPDPKYAALRVAKKPPFSARSELNGDRPLKCFQSWGRAMRIGLIGFGFIGSEIYRRIAREGGPLSLCLLYTSRCV